MLVMTNMHAPAKSLKAQAGILLLEGLIAILIFSLGILAIVGMQATAVKQAGDAHYRSEASLLAEQLIGRMWADKRDSATLQTKFATGGSEYTTWLNYVKDLPNGQATVDVLSDPTLAADGTVTITIKWLLPSEPSTSQHKYVAVAQIK